MASWYMEQRQQQTMIGRQRRHRALIVLGLAWFTYLAWWGGRNLLG